MNIEKTTQERVRENLRVKINEPDLNVWYAEGLRQSKLDFVKWLSERK